MFGLFDDEIGPADTSVGTEAGLVFYDAAAWQLDLVNLTNTPAGRNWYPNAAPRVYLHPNGRRYLDMLWIDGVHNPLDVYEPNYQVIYSALDLGPPVPGDLDGDGNIDIADYQLFSQAMDGPQQPPGDWAADLDGDGDCDLQDLALFAMRFGGGA